MVLDILKKKLVKNAKKRNHSNTTYHGKKQYAHHAIGGHTIMKQLNETFEDKEFEFIQEKKGKQTWRQFILNLVGYFKK